MHKSLGVTELWRAGSWLIARLREAFWKKSPLPTPIVIVDVVPAPEVLVPEPPRVVEPKPPVVILLATTQAPNDPYLLRQLAVAERYRTAIEVAWRTHGVQPCILAALPVREAEWGFSRFLVPPGIEGVGDHGYGHGVYQFDVRWHPVFIASGRWRDPGASALEAARLVAKYRAYVARRALDKLGINLQGLDRERGGVAAYNGGPGNVLKGLRLHYAEAGIDAVDFYTADGPDPDRAGDYSRDVLATPRGLAGWFQSHGWA